LLSILEEDGMSAEIGGVDAGDWVIVSQYVLSNESGQQSVKSVKEEKQSSLS